jgi:hypothetical protein
MPTKYERIGVIKDEALADALASVESIVGEATPVASVVHDLAVRGAQALREDASRQQGLLHDLARLSTSEAPPWDREVLARIDALTGG